MSQKSFLSILLFGLLVFTACKKDDDDPVTCANYIDEIQAKLNVVLSTSNAFSLDPSTEKCEAYKAAVADYLDTSENFIDCVPAQDREQYQQDIDDLQAEIDQLNC